MPEARLERTRRAYRDVHNRVASALAMAALITDVRVSRQRLSDDECQRLIVAFFADSPSEVGDILGHDDLGVVEVRSIDDNGQPNEVELLKNVTG